MEGLSSALLKLILAGLFRQAGRQQKMKKKKKPQTNKTRTIIPTSTLSVSDLLPHEMAEAVRLCNEVSVEHLGAGPTRTGRFGWLPAPSIPRWQGSPDGTVTCTRNNSLSRTADVRCLNGCYVAEVFKRSILGNNCWLSICLLCAAPHSSTAAWGRFDPPEGGTGFLKMKDRLRVRCTPYLAGVTQMVCCFWQVLFLVKRSAGFYCPVAMGKLPWFEKLESQLRVWDRGLISCLLKGCNV